MDTNPQNQEPTSTPTPEESKGAVGPLVGIVIILVIVVFGALYYWGSLLNEREQAQVPLIPSDEQGQNAVNEDGVANDDITSIESDLNLSDVNELDAQLNADLEALDNAF